MTPPKKKKPKDEKSTSAAKVAVAGADADEAFNFQALITSSIQGKVDLPDLQGRKVQGVKFDLEISLDQFQKDFRREIEELFLGDPVLLKFRNQDRTTQFQTATYIRGYSHDFRGSGDDEVEFYRVTVLIFRRKSFDFDKLYDLQLEKFIYVEVTPAQVSLDDDQGKLFQKKKDPKKDDNQGELGGEDGE